MSHKAPGPLFFTLYINYIFTPLEQCKAPICFWWHTEIPAKSQTRPQFIIFSKSRKPISPAHKIWSFNGTTIERVPSYKYLGKWPDDSLLKLMYFEIFKRISKTVCLSRIRPCPTLENRKLIVQSTIPSFSDYGDIVYMHAAPSVLKQLDTVISLDTPNMILENCLLAFLPPIDGMLLKKLLN